MNDSKCRQFRALYAIKLWAMVDMNESDSSCVQGFRCYKQLKAINDMSPLGLKLKVVDAMITLVITYPSYSFSLLLPTDCDENNEIKADGGGQIRRDAERGIRWWHAQEEMRGTEKEQKGEHEAKAPERQTFRCSRRAIGNEEIHYRGVRKRPFGKFAARSRTHGRKLGSGSTLSTPWRMHLKAKTNFPSTSPTFPLTMPHSAIESISDSK
ncbi:hypothetical protein CK203_008262 [Vitis vinifera]|uniref:Uncharacterized protein n=1 Tax=Vitis vinifera TaxID=29760 RepID=A0A438KP27_VITVI|nr:hypothetical protein CK203_008262 [Vitis vinifera]